MAPFLRETDEKNVYTLCGYLVKVSQKQKSLSQLFGTKPGKGLVKEKWIVFSQRTCKLFYYKEKGDTECMGEINLAGAFFNYDPEDGNGVFCIV